MLSLRPSFSRTAFFLNVPIFLELRLILNPLFICLHLPLEEKTTRDIGNAHLALHPLLHSQHHSQLQINPFFLARGGCDDVYCVSESPFNSAFR